jgi:GPI ethanolamine phosphate transferase 1
MRFLTIFAGMTLSFFYNVTDTGIISLFWTPLFVNMFHAGSWLEIGQSISFFCITSLLLVWSGGICAIGELMMEETIKSWKYRLKSD